MRYLGTWLVLMFVLVPAVQSDEIELQAQLLGSLSTEGSRKGDRISARVLAPVALHGDVVEGQVTNVRSGGKIRGQSVLSFTFETLRHGNEAVPIASQVQSVVNSKGQADVDEEGRVLRKSNNVGKAVAGTAVGGLIGGIAGGRRGAAIGAGAGALVSIVLIEVAAQAPEIRLDPGSQVTLSAKSRSGPSLASLTAAAPTGVAAAPAQPAPAANPAPVAAQAPSAVAPAQAAPEAPAQPDLTAVKADFIPGAKTIFYDDFTDMAGDEPPPHWKVRGGKVELKIGGDIRQLTTDSTVTLVPNLKGLPKNFTIEREIKFEASHGNSVWYLHGKDWSGPTGPYAALTVFTQFATEQKEMRVWLRSFIDGKLEDLADLQVPVDFGQPIKQSLWIQNGRLRVYVNDQRVVDVNQIDLEPLTGVEFVEDAGIGYRLTRFAESTPDFSQVIASTGRYVTHGILFDVGSDRLKPESAAVIRLVAAGLQKNPNLKLRIEGHTDSTGNAEHNLDLSKRRAAAVKEVLVSQFSVDAGRLTTDGLGPTKPIDSNDTPSGRAQNRRVEFVRQ
jgi:OmpA-OmpF porin, OOP family